MLTNKGTLFGRQLLKPETVEMMTSNQVGRLFDRAKKGRPGREYGYTAGITRDPKLAGNGQTAGTFGAGGAADTVSWSSPGTTVYGRDSKSRCGAGGFEY